MSEKNKYRSLFGVIEPHEIKDMIVSGWESLIDVAGTMHKVHSDKQKGE